MIDFKKITEATSRYCFHSHTQFCDARDTMEHMVEGAIAAGMLHYGFSPHSPVPVPSPCNMSAADVPLYLAEVERLKEVFAGKINLYASMEIDYLGEQWGPSHEFFNDIPLDYKIGSVHFIPDPADATQMIDIDGPYDAFDEKMHRYFHDDVEFVVRSFYYQTLQMIEAGGFDIIGHFDKIGNNANHFRPGIELEPWYEALVKRTFEAILDHGYIIEVNTKAMDTAGRLFPNQRYFPWLRRYHAPLLVNSDAHFPHLTDAGRSEAFKLINELI